MKTFPDFKRDLSSSKSGNLFFISASEGYFISKAIRLLKEKLLNDVSSNDNFYHLYADSLDLSQLLDITSNSASLFSSTKIVVVRRCELLKKKLDTFLDEIKKAEDTFLLLCFDSEFVIEKKLTARFNFYDFSSLQPNEYFDWAKNEFKENGYEPNDEFLNKYLSILPQHFDLVSNEIKKICTYLIKSNITPENNSQLNDLIFREGSLGININELFKEVVKKNNYSAHKILNDLIEKESMSEIFIVSLLISFYSDLLIFKNKDVNVQSRDLYTRYQIWGERAKIANSLVNDMSVELVLSSLNNIQKADYLLKFTQISPGLIMVSLIESLATGSGTFFDKLS